jgi:DNA-binding protein HU-beta
MNKSELIDAIATRTELTKTASGKVLEAVIESIVTAVATGNGVSLVGFGSFKASPRAAREGKNPKTGEKIKIAATTVPKFTAGATFKAAVVDAATAAAAAAAVAAALAAAPAKGKKKK